MASPTFYTKTQITRLKLKDLQDALEDRGLDTSGGVLELKQRLREAIHPASSSQLGSSQPNVTNVTYNSDPASQPNEVWDLIKVKSGPVYKRIPKPSRLHACKAFTTIITNVTRNNDKDSWESLLNFARCGIGSSTRGGKKKKKQTTVINERLESFMNGVLNPVPKPKKKYQPNLKNRVTTKMNAGDIRGAVRVVTSKETILPPSEEITAKLREKHPPSNPNSIFPQVQNAMENIIVNKDDIQKAIRSFGKGVSGGPDGLLPQHLMDMTGEALGQPAEALLNALVNFYNLIVYPGEIPTQILPTFYGANLLALDKPGGGIRPIAVGLTLRRLSGKATMPKLYDFCEKEFRPFQVGVGCPKGAEAAVHSVRSYLENENTKDKSLLKIDFKNAFNCVRRDVILGLVKEKVPKIFNYVNQVAHNSHLFFGDHIIDSEEGVQQGDPMGSFLFSLAIMDIIKSLKSELNICTLTMGLLQETPTQSWKITKKLFPQ